MNPTTTTSRRITRRSWILGGLIGLVCIALGVLTTLTFAFAPQLWRFFDREYKPRKTVVPYWLVAGETIHPSAAGKKVSVVAAADSWFQSVGLHMVLFNQDVEDFNEAGKLLTYTRIKSGSPPSWVIDHLRSMLRDRERRIGSLHPEGRSDEDAARSIKAPISDFMPKFFTAGWPLRAFYAESASWSYGPPENQKEISANTFYTLTADQQRLLRTQTTRLIATPLWSGIILNTLFFSALYALFPFAVVLLIRRRRLKKNHCRNCNYNLAGLAIDAPCPECGTFRPKRSDAAAIALTPTAPPPRP